MKRIAIILLLTTCHVLSFGQLTKGTKHVGAALGFHYTTGSERFGSGLINNYQSTVIDVLPQLGFIRSGRFSWGIAAGYGYEERRSDISETVHRGIVNPFMRMYKMYDKIGLFAQTDIYLSYGYMTRGISYNGNYTTNNVQIGKGQIGISPGLIFFLNDRISVETTTGFLGATINIDQYASYFDVGIMKPHVNVSFQFYLPKKKESEGEVE